MFSLSPISKYAFTAFASMSKFSTPIFLANIKASSDIKHSFISSKLSSIKFFKSGKAFA